MKRNTRLHNVVLAGRVAIGLTLPALVHSVLLLIVLLITTGNAAAVEADPGEMGKGEPTPENYSPFVNQNFPDRVLWGATHIHTALSADAGLTGVTLGPADMFRYVRGEVVTIDSGLKVRLDRPLDWFAVTDHAEYMGLADQIRSGEPALLATPIGKNWYDMSRQGEAGGLQGRLRSYQVHLPKQGRGQEPSAQGLGLGGSLRGGRAVQPAGRFHHASRLRMDVGARRQQSSSHRHFPRRRGPREADRSVFRLRQPGSGGSLEVHGQIREADGRQGPRHPA